MLPDNALSTQVLSSNLLGGRALPVSLKADHESGPISVGDPSQGMQYQIWSGDVRDDGIYIWADNHSPVKYISEPNITEFSFTFDQNGNLSITYIQYGRTYIWWYDTTIGSMTTTYIGNTFVSPKISLDDKRRQATNTNDIILGYIRNNVLCYRQQRDRFLIEYSLASGISGRIEKIGMGVNMRFQFHIWRI